MKTERNIQELLLKFIREECTRKEIEDVLAHVRSVKTINGMPSFEDVLSLLDEVPDMEYDRAQDIYAQIIMERKKRPTTPIKKRLFRYASAAAVMVGLLALGYFYQQGMFDTETKNILLPGNDSITLQMEDGIQKNLKEEGEQQLFDANGNIIGRQQGGRITYNTPSAYSQPNGTEATLAYNTLKVPYGKRFDVVLSDGTTIYLNSGTELKYPVLFLETGNREVYVKGEAYFNVTSDKARPFVVNVEELNIEVLGTEFNVLAYPEDRVTEVVLVEGSVDMSYGASPNKERGTVLFPEFKGVFDKTVKSINTEKVNTNVYTAWRNGELVLRQMPLDNILKKLERHYNIKIVNNNKALGQEVFNASFKDQSIEKVLGYLNTLYGIEYTIRNNTIIIN